MPRPFNEGAAVVVHYLGTTEAGVVERVEDDGRTLVVVTEHDEVLRFHLMASTYFITADHSARLTHA
jgi:hypothetical protein